VDLEPAILEAAEALLEELGPAGLSVRGIAQRAGVAPMGLYSRFEGKFGVIDALYEQGFAALASSIEATRAIAEPLEAFRAAGLAYRALALEHPARYQLMFLRAVPGHDPSERAITTANGTFERLVDAVGRCVDAGSLADRDVVLMAQQVFATVHGWMALELGGIGFVQDADPAYDDLLDMLVVGLGGSTAPPAD
jgi:AcrR family transcriptional regulator